MTERFIEREPDLVFPDPRIIKLDEQLLYTCLQDYCQAHKEARPILYLCREMWIDEVVVIRSIGSPLEKKVEELWRIVQRRNHLLWLKTLLNDSPDRIRCSSVILCPSPPYVADPTDSSQLGNFVHSRGLYEDFNRLVERYPIKPEGLSPKEILEIIADQPPFFGSLLYFALKCFGWDWKNLGNCLESPDNISMLEKAWEKELWEPVGRVISIAYERKRYLQRTWTTEQDSKRIHTDRDLKATMNDIARNLTKI